MADCFWTDLVKCTEDCGSVPPETPFAIYDFTAPPYALEDRIGGPTEPLVWEVPYTTDVPTGGSPSSWLYIAFDAHITPASVSDTFDFAAYTEFLGAEYALAIRMGAGVDEGENAPVRMAYPDSYSDVSLEVGSAGTLRLVITPGHGLALSNVFLSIVQPF